MGIALLNGCIVFIYDDHSFHAVMLMEHSCQYSQGTGEGDLIRGTGNDGCVELFFHGIAGAAVRQLFVAGIFAPDIGSDVLQCVIPGGIFHIFKRKVDYRILALKAAVVFATGPDGFVFKEYRSIRRSAFKENPHHVHVQGFAKTPGSGKQRHLGQCIEKIADQQSFVDIIVIADCFHIAGNAHWQRKELRMLFRLPMKRHLCVLWY